MYGARNIMVCPHFTALGAGPLPSKRGKWITKFTQISYLAMLRWLFISWSFVEFGWWDNYPKYKSKSTTVRLQTNKNHILEFRTNPVQMLWNNILHHPCLSLGVLERGMVKGSSWSELHTSKITTVCYQFTCIVFVHYCNLDIDQITLLEGRKQVNSKGFP